MTDTEVEGRIKAGQARARARREKVLVKREQSKQNAAEIKGMGYRLNYDLSFDRMISIAYTWDFATGIGHAYFAVKSLDDSFAKAKAREVLLKHMNENTHCLEFKCGNSSGNSIRPAILRSLYKRMKTHSYEFPTKIKRILLRRLATNDQKSDV